MNSNQNIEGLSIKDKEINSKIDLFNALINNDADISEIEEFLYKNPEIITGQKLYINTDNQPRYEDNNHNKKIINNPEYGKKVVDKACYPLAVSIRRDRYDVAEMLIEREANLDITDEFGASIEDVCRDKKVLEIISQKIQKRLKINDVMYNGLRSKNQRDFKEVIKDLRRIEKGQQSKQNNYIIVSSDRLHDGQVDPSALDFKNKSRNMTSVKNNKNTSKQRSGTVVEDTSTNNTKFFRRSSERASKSPKKSDRNHPSPRINMPLPLIPEPNIKNTDNFPEMRQNNNDFVRPITELIRKSQDNDEPTYVDIDNVYNLGKGNNNKIKGHPVNTTPSYLSDNNKKSGEPIYAVPIKTKKQISQYLVTDLNEKSEGIISPYAVTDINTIPVDNDHAIIYSEPWDVNNPYTTPIRSMNQNQGGQQEVLNLQEWHTGRAQTLSVIKECDGDSSISSFTNVTNLTSSFTSISSLSENESSIGIADLESNNTPSTSFIDTNVEIAHKNVEITDKKAKI